MKKLLLLLLITVTAISFTSCKKDDDATLEGTWVSTKIGQMAYVNEVLKAEAFHYTTLDNEKIIIAFQGNQWVQYSANSDEIPSFSADDTFVYADGKISFTGNAELPSQLEVKSLTSRTLVLKIEQTENEDGESRKQIQEITFEKR